MNGPPEKEEPGPTPETGPRHKALADGTTNTPSDLTRACRQLPRRRAASWRLPALKSGHSDPWYYQPPGVPGYAEAARHLLGCGLTPAPNSAGLREMWKRGGQQRQTAELIVERWDLVA